MSRHSTSKSNAKSPSSRLLLFAENCSVALISNINYAERGASNLELTVLHIDCVGLDEGKNVPDRDVELLRLLPQSSATVSRDDNHIYTISEVSQSTVESRETRGSVILSVLIVIDRSSVFKWCLDCANYVRL